ncbi:DUF6382 domain-containing protein [Pseudobacteroides cellulosolvens]|uniref:Forkhead-associated protein n=1 Tax=Pseudobacteroides cellulosolvens ATCC 35603 = DSM 2933 TaxID=398512 RepID=A0A0L6JH70_9FIRM|nr:DUF6382 domain-containing protein [Pseudobacteroides cellulosolvens]KNY25073.1 Forkhead-associated protein [Pseudobacteroides cellulosolvens ATCC 35603 = DSM 2933]
MSYLKDLFRFEFESDSSSSYLVLRNLEEDKLQKLQIEMIEQNPHVNIVPLSLRVKNNEYMIFYNITSKITLSKLLKRKNLKKDEFLDLLISICKTILDCKNYYAHDKNFAIDEDMIYVNPANLDASLIYIPVNFQVSFKDVFVQFVKKLIDDLVRIDECEDLGFLQRIRIQLREDIFSIKEFINFLTGFRYKTESKFDSNRSISEEFAPENDTKNKIVQQKCTLIKERDNSQEIKLPKAAAGDQKAAINIPPSAGTNKLKDQKPNNTFIPVGVNSSSSRDTALIYPKKSIYAAIGLQALVIIIIAISIIGVLKSKGQDFSIILGVAIVLAAVDFLIMRNLFDKNKMIPANITESRSFYISSKDNQNETRTKEDGKGHKEKHTGNKEIYTGLGEIECDAVGRMLANDLGTEILYDNCKDDTVILKESQNHPYLIGKNDGKNMKIIINKDSFLIGRLKSEVDCEINNTSISKIHTEIIKRDGHFFIKDLNSSNGTYVNSERIKSNFEIEIKNHDIIGIANLEFEFLVFRS